MIIILPWQLGTAGLSFRFRAPLRRLASTNQQRIYQTQSCLVPRSHLEFSNLRACFFNQPVSIGLITPALKIVDHIRRESPFKCNRSDFKRTSPDSRKQFFWTTNFNPMKGINMLHMVRASTELALGEHGNHLRLEYLPWLGTVHPFLNASNQNWEDEVASSWSLYELQLGLS